MRRQSEISSWLFGFRADHLKDYMGSVSGKKTKYFKIIKSLAFKKNKKFHLMILMKNYKMRPLNCTYCSPTFGMTHQIMVNLAKWQPIRMKEEKRSVIQN